MLDMLKTIGDVEVGHTFRKKLYPTVKPGSNDCSCGVALVRFSLIETRSAGCLDDCFTEELGLGCFAAPVAAFKYDEISFFVQVDLSLYSYMISKLYHTLWGMSRFYLFPVEPNPPSPRSVASSSSTSTNVA